MQRHSWISYEEQRSESSRDWQKKGKEKEQKLKDLKKSETITSERMWQKNKNARWLRVCLMLLRSTVQLPQSPR